jgi:hypothetical protein
MPVKWFAFEQARTYTSIGLDIVCRHRSIGVLPQELTPDRGHEENFFHECFSRALSVGWIFEKYGISRRYPVFHLPLAAHLQTMCPVTSEVLI